VLTLKKLRLLRGMRRSGNHALVQWMVAQSGWVFFNNIVNIGPYIRLNQPLPLSENLPSWLWRRAALFGKRRWQTFCWLVRKPLLFGLEDHALTFKPFRTALLDEIDILVLRSPANMFASRLRQRWPSVSIDTKIGRSRGLELWKSYAREFIGQTAVLGNKTCICYDLWFTCEEYRRDLAEVLGLAFSDAGCDRLAPYGGGSSFEGLAAGTDPSKLNVLRRFAQLEGADKKLLQESLSDPELAELWSSVVKSLSKYQAAEHLKACDWLA